MIKGSRRSTARVHLPLRRLALCLDCDVCFEIGDDPCPACGSETWTPLARFLEMPSAESVSHFLDGLDEPTPRRHRYDTPSRSRHLIIVARNRPKLYEHLKRAFAGNETVQVILDRRVGERRQSNAAKAPERRRGDRRARQPITEQLRAMGWSVVVLDLAKNGRAGTR
jgi:hypothetical protein